MYIGGKDYRVGFVNDKKFKLKNYLYINGRIVDKK